MIRNNAYYCSHEEVILLNRKNKQQPVGPTKIGNLTIEIFKKFMN